MLLQKTIAHQKHVFLLFFLFISVFSISKGQTDTLLVVQKNSRKLSKWVAPTLLTVGGTLLVRSSADENIYQYRHRHFSSFKNSSDDYLQYVPAVAYLGMHFLGSGGVQKNILNKGWLLAKATLVNSAIVLLLKESLQRQRPDGSDNRSFVSGHTAWAFLGASLVHLNYGKQSVWYSIGAFSLASGIGAMRLLNDKHWFSDTLAGAGIGMFSAYAVWYTHRNKLENNLKKKISINFRPALLPQATYGFVGCIRF
jgi:membrane-associated phospholipid phosphatase